MKISEERKLNDILRTFGKLNEAMANEENIRQVVLISKGAFFESEEKRITSYREFLFQQGRYVRKKWWFIQLAVTFALYICLCTMSSEYTMQRVMGVAAPMFVIMILPELWKNKESSSMEIEGAAFYSLRQVYSARLTIFAFADGLLITLFFVLTLATTQIKLGEMILQFLLPMTVTCCICFRILCSRVLSSEYAAIFLSLLWSGFWIVIVTDRETYTLISIPVWAIICFLAAAYFVYVVRKTMNECENIWESCTGLN